jgi:hypothetical protein
VAPITAIRSPRVAKNVVFISLLHWALRVPERRLILDPQLRRPCSAEVEAVTKLLLAGPLIKALTVVDLDPDNVKFLPTESVEQ